MEVSVQSLECGKVEKIDLPLSPRLSGEILQSITPIQKPMPPCRSAISRQRPDKELDMTQTVEEARKAVDRQECHTQYRGA